MLKKIDRRTANFVYNIVTADETMIYSNEPKTEQKSIVWTFQDERNPTKVIHSRSIYKKMFTCFSLVVPDMSQTFL